MLREKFGEGTLLKQKFPVNGERESESVIELN